MVGFFMAYFLLQHCFPLFKGANRTEESKLVVVSWLLATHLKVYGSLALQVYHVRDAFDSR